MDVYILKVILEILKWPITVIVSILILKKPVTELVNGVTDFNLGGKNGLSARVKRTTIITNPKNKGENNYIESIDLKYFSKDKTGKVIFDYSNNDGIYTFGEKDYRFDTMWSKASNESIHFYNDKPTIKSVRLVKDISDIDKVNPISYDSSSRARTANIGQIAIFENYHNKFLLIKILDIKDDSRGDKNDELTLEYKIIG